MAWVAAVAWVQSLAWDLPYAMEIAKKKKKEKKRKEKEWIINAFKDCELQLFYLLWQNCCIDNLLCHKSACSKDVYGENTGYDFLIYKIWRLDFIITFFDCKFMKYDKLCVLCSDIQGKSIKKWHCSFLTVLKKKSLLSVKGGKEE